MDMRQLGDLWPVSALTLGGGGLGQIWGKTNREEAVATARLAADLGITLFDMAPLYGRGEAEDVMGEAFEGRLPEGARVTTKCMLGSPAPEEVAAKLERSLQRSLKAMRLEHVDLFFLHSNICPDDYVYGEEAETQDRWATRLSLYADHVVPALEGLKEKGLIGAWGITGTGLPVSIMEALRLETKPAAVQAVANLLDSAGSMRRFEEPPEPRNVIRTAKNNDVGVMGIRAVQAGALTAAIDRPLAADHPEFRDFEKAAPFRALCKELGEDPALLAHRYALSMEGVDTVVLGVKNREELQACVAAAEKGPLEAELRKRVDALRLNFQFPRMPIG